MTIPEFRAAREALESGADVVKGGLHFQKDTDHKPRILDSGARRSFESGAVRDIAEGKGRCDLLPFDILADVTDHQRFYSAFDGFVRRRETEPIVGLIRVLLFKLDDSETLSGGLLELAKHFEEGAKKYEARNWEQGIPLHCYVDSALRHYLKYSRGDEDEPHLRACVWNLVCMLWTYKHRPELDDLPPVEGVARD